MEVKLQAYEGPLDLLLRLIERAEINIYDIPIAELTGQYLAAIRELEPDMANISEFIVMAATLLEIKSRMLLPKPPKPEQDEEDPRDVLVRRLLEYKSCQEIAEKLQNCPDPGSRLTRGAEADLINRFALPPPIPPLSGVSLDDLWLLFNETLMRQESRIDRVRADYGDMPKERFTLSEKITHLRACIKAHGRFSLSEILEECISRGEMVVTFLAMLEMIRQGWVRVRQDRMFREIVCEEAK